MIPLAQVQLSEREIEAVTEVLRSGKLREGEKCRQFEQRFAQVVGAQHATTMANGTVALHAAYMSLTEPGDEVIVPALTFFATASMVSFAGGKPVFCDVDRKTFTIDLNDVESKITSKTKAIAPVHLFGNACDIDEIRSLADRYGLRVVWDAAQAHLAKYKGNDVGAFGDVVCYSFYATKNMTTGEGGMITSDDEEIIKNCVLIKHQGQTGKYFHTVLGTNYRMTDIQAAIGLVQLEQLPWYTERRRENASYLMTNLCEIETITVPYAHDFVEHSYHHFTVLLDIEALDVSRDQFVERLLSMGVQAGVNYPTPLHKQPVFKEAGQNSLPNAEWIAQRCVSLPVHPHLTENDLQRIVTSVSRICNGKGDK